MKNEELSPCRYIFLTSIHGLFHSSLFIFTYSSVEFAQLLGVEGVTEMQELQTTLLAQGAIKQRKKPTSATPASPATPEFHKSRKLKSFIF